MVSFKAPPLFLPRCSVCTRILISHFKTPPPFNGMSISLRNAKFGSKRRKKLSMSGHLKNRRMGWKREWEWVERRAWRKKNGTNRGGKWRQKKCNLVPVSFPFLVFYNTKLLDCFQTFFRIFFVFFFLLPNIVLLDSSSPVFSQKSRRLPSKIALILFAPHENWEISNEMRHSSRRLLWTQLCLPRGDTVVFEVVFWEEEEKETKRVPLVHPYAHEIWNIDLREKKESEKMSREIR